MECKFVIGQRVVAVREKCYPCEMCRSDDKSRGATVRQGGVYTVSMVGISPALRCPHGADWPAMPVIDLVEKPSENNRRYRASSFRPVHTMEFWLGAKQELKEKA